MIFKPEIKKIGIPVAQSGGNNHKRMISQQIFENPNNLLHSSFNQGVIPKSKSPVIDTSQNIGV